MGEFILEKQTFTKLEIADILYNFASFTNYSLMYPNISFRDAANLAFKVPSSFTFDGYYNLMTETFIMFLIRKYFISMYDVEFPYLKEADIDAASISSDIFVNPNDARCFSKKQIIKFIRNALCHNNDDSNELYQLIIEDSKILFEINLQNVQPRPFHVKINIDQLSKLMFSLFSASKTDAVIIKKKKDFIDFNVVDVMKAFSEDILYRHVYAKISPSKRAETDAKIIVDNAIVEQEYSDFSFLEEQAKKVQEDFNYMKQFCDVNQLRTYVIKNVMPLAVAKKENYEKIMCLLGGFMVYPEKSMNDFFADVVGFVESREGYTSKIAHNYETAAEFVYSCKWDLDSIGTGVSSIFFEYMFSSFVTDSKIKINGVEEDTEKIRNAFIHSRWFLGENGEFCLLDWQNGDRNEMNLNWKRIFSCSHLLDALQAQIQAKIEEKQKNNT